MIKELIQLLTGAKKKEQQIEAAKDKLRRETYIVTKKIEKMNMIIDKKTTTYYIAKAMGVLK